MYGMNREQAIAELQKAGFEYVGPSGIENKMSAALVSPPLTARPADAPKVPFIDPWTKRKADKEIDVFGINPVVQYVRQRMPSVQFVGPPPEMFSAGALPLITASGAPPEILRNLHWRLRHSGAFADTLGELLGLLEKGHDVPVEDELDRYQNDTGRAALREFLARVWTWATALPQAEPLTPDQVAELFGRPNTSK